jgi:hypothetical protein
MGDYLARQGDVTAAEATLRVVTAAGHPEWSPAAEVVQGVSVGRGRSSQKWRRWVRRDPS